MSSYSIRNAWASGLMFFAAVVMLTVGVCQALQGIAALAEDEDVVNGADYTFQFDLTTWGWIHLVAGVVLAVVGGFLFSGTTWARWAGIVVAALCLIANFMWLPYYPLWALVLIALNVAVIWALAVAEVAPDHYAPAP